MNAEDYGDHLMRLACALIAATVCEDRVEIERLRAEIRMFCEEHGSLAMREVMR